MGRGHLSLEYSRVFRLLVAMPASILFLFGCAVNKPSIPIPFASDSVEFSIFLEGDASIHAVLDDEIRFQRKNNRELQQFSKRSKIARFESRLLTERLHAKGYYDALVKITFSKKAIIYRVITGEPYRVKTLSLQLPPGVDVSKDIIDIAIGDPVSAEKVLAATKSLAAYVAEKSCLYRIDTDYEVILESATHAAHITLTVADSPLVRFGDIHFSGLRSINEDYLFEQLTIAKGDCFKRKRIDAVRLALVQSNLIASVKAEIGEPKNNEVPVTLHVVERHHRTLSAGGGFQTDEGFGVSFGWEHRNLMQRGQRLKINTRIAENLQSFSTDLVIPHFRRKNQTITLYGDVIREDTDAFESKAADLGAEISRQRGKHLRATAGSELSFSNVEENGISDNFALVSLPLSLEYDRRNDPLDPRHGWVAAGLMRPYWDAYEADTSFVKSTLAASAYISFDNTLWQPTLALRSAVGVIEGTSRDAVPANVRFYTGGGGSVRGYPFQTLGPLNGETPQGGLSFTEFSFETRLRWGKSWGGVLFLDGGFAYEETTPQVGEDLHWGAGFGIRYYTSFAPLRVDFALPLDKREGIDDDFQLYISIGQAF